VEYALGCRRHTLRSVQVSRPKTRALSPVVPAVLLRLRPLAMRFCWHIPSTQSYRVSNCCTLVLLHHTSSCVFGKYHIPFWSCWRTAVFGRPSSGQNAGRPCSGLWYRLRTHGDRSRAAVACGGVAPWGVSRDGGVLGTLWDRYSSDAQIAVDQWEVACAGVPLGSALGLDRIPVARALQA